MTATDNVFQHDSGIDPAEVAEVRKLIGTQLRIPAQFNHEATLDTIRHYAHGLGDDNPLWCDEDYASNGVYGTIVAPPTFYYTMFAPGITPGFAGLQAFFGTGRWEVNRLARRGERIMPTARFVDMHEVQGRRAKSMLVQVGETEYRTPQGELLARYISKAIRAPRANREDGLRYEPRKTRRYTIDELADIERQVLAQTRTGARPLHWEDVSVGDPLPTRVKGPLNYGSMMAYYAGNLNGLGYTACEMQWRVRHQALTQPQAVPNNRAIGWLLEATWPGVGHMNDDVAQTIGMPAAYDNGWNRLGWMGQLVTDWIGDRGMLAVLEVRAVAPNLMGDTLWCKGIVSGKRREGDRHLVDLDLHADNQDGAQSCRGTAVVALPSRTQGS